MKKITSLFLTLLLAIAITPSNADHHEKSVEQEIQAALKAGKITEKEAKDKLAYLERRKAEAKKIAETQKKTNNTTSKKKTNQATAKKKAAQEAARKKAAAKKKAESKKAPTKKKAAQEAARKKAAAKKKAESKKAPAKKK